MSAWGVGTRFSKSQRRTNRTTRTKLCFFLVSGVKEGYWKTIWESPLYQCTCAVTQPAERENPGAATQFANERQTVKGVERDIQAARGSSTTSKNLQPKLLSNDVNVRIFEAAQYCVREFRISFKQWVQKVKNNKDLEWLFIWLTLLPLTLCF